MAYQVLSDPELRHKYNEFGQKNGGGMSEPAGGFHDPEEVFGKMFGGDRFEVLIGNISIGRCTILCLLDTEVDTKAGKDMKEAFQQQHEEDPNDFTIGPNGRPILTPAGAQKRWSREKKVAEEKARQRQARVDQLATHLTNKLNIYTEAAKGPQDEMLGASFKEICRLEAE